MSTIDGGWLHQHQRFPPSANVNDSERNDVKARSSIETQRTHADVAPASTRRPVPYRSSPDTFRLEPTRDFAPWLTSAPFSLVGHSSTRAPGYAPRSTLSIAKSTRCRETSASVSP